MTNAKEIWKLASATIDEWQEDRASTWAASLACYSLLSMSPLGVLVVAVLGLVVGKDAARMHVYGQVQEVAGPAAGEAVREVIERANAPTGGLLSSLVAVVVLFMGASGVFIELKDSLNSIWNVKTKPGRGIKGIVIDRFLSFTMILGVAFVLLVSLILSALISAMGTTIAAALPGGNMLWSAVNIIVSFGLVTALFAAMYKVIPDVKIAWKNIWPGALATAALFQLGKFLLGLYLGRASVISPYGAAGSLVALVLWVYYSAQIFFLGAELTQVLAKVRGDTLEPKANAVALPDATLDKLVSPAKVAHGLK